MNQEQKVVLPSNRSLTLAELSQAWEYLESLPQYPLGEWNPPSNLKELSLLDWEVVSHLLLEEFHQKSESEVH